MAVRSMSSNFSPSFVSRSFRPCARFGRTSLSQPCPPQLGKARTSVLLYPARRTFSMAPSNTSAQTRLSLISRHLDPRPFPSINTPYTIDRTSHSLDDLPYIPHTRSLSTSSRKMSIETSKQDEHPSVLIPGPVEITDEVSQTMAKFAQSHMSIPFVSTFGETLTLLRDLFQTKNPGSQPFIISGSGTLGWDLVAANLVEPGEEVLVLHTGYFADSFADCLTVYGAKPTQLKAPVGQRPQLPEIEKALKEKKFKALTVTHVDTSTGVLSKIAALSELIQRVSPETPLIVDGVCSIGAEELHFDDMKVDAALTASQKAIGCPPGLSILMVSEKAMNVYKSRKSPPGSYYASFKNWLPIMQSYEAKKPAYFATPPTQLVNALNTALKQLLKNPVSQRFDTHKQVSDRVKKAVEDMGLKQVANDPDEQSHAMTAMYLPDGLTPPEILPKLLERGVVFAGGLHKEIATKYIRFGHMGVTVTEDQQRGEVDKALKVLKETLDELKQAKGQ